jgi:hypothetical protein
MPCTRRPATHTASKRGSKSVLASKPANAKKGRPAATGRKVKSASSGSSKGLSAHEEEPATQQTSDHDDDDDDEMLFSGLDDGSEDEIERIVCSAAESNGVEVKAEVESVAAPTQACEAVKEDDSSSAVTPPPPSSPVNVPPSTPICRSKITPAPRSSLSATPHSARKLQLIHVTDQAVQREDSVSSTADTEVLGDSIEPTQLDE